MTTALQSTTPSGLPFPESSGPLNQGANDIKALALALDGRTPFAQAEIKSVSVNCSGGVGTITFAKPFTKAPTVLLTANVGSAGGGNYYVPVPGIISVTAANVQIYVAAILTGSSPNPIQGWGGSTTINYAAFA